MKLKFNFALQESKTNNFIYLRMVIYNITLKIDWAIHDDFLITLRSTKDQLLNNSSNISDSGLYQLMGVDTQEGPTYCLQFHFDSTSPFNLFIAQEETILKKALSDKYADKYIIFSSVLSEIE